MNDAEQPERMKCLTHHRPGHGHLLRHLPLRGKRISLMKQAIFDCLYDLIEYIIHCIFFIYFLKNNLLCHRFLPVLHPVFI